METMMYELKSAQKINAESGLIFAVKISKYYNEIAESVVKWATQPYDYSKLDDILEGHHLRTKDITKLIEELKQIPPKTVRSLRLQDFLYVVICEELIANDENQERASEVEKNILKLIEEIDSDR